MFRTLPLEFKRTSNQSGQGAPTVCNVLVNLADPGNLLHGKMDLVTGEIFDVVNWEGRAMLKGAFADQTHGSGDAYDLQGGTWVTLSWTAAP